MSENVFFGDTFKGKKVLITGHTGFKGSWLSNWLLHLGAEVIGISNEIPTTPSMFEVLDMEKRINHNFLDIRDYGPLEQLVYKTEPDFIFHMAAQAIVSESYKDPLNTITTNVLGTSNMLEVLRKIKHECIAVIITSDKCYENVEQVWGYKENDQLGGKDIYSGSKGAAELMFHSYFYSFFKDKIDNVRLASVRAGNVIGGGDWAKDRIVVDCMKAWSENKKVTIRSPKATRPWQHALEPLSGYLTTAVALHQNKELNGESFNFGPKSEQNHTVLKLLKDLSKYWDFKDEKDAFVVTDNIAFHEAGLLKLNCDKALFHLKWEPNLNYDQTIKFVSEWYFNFYRGDTDMFDFTHYQLEEYQENALKQHIIWTK